MVHAFTRVYVCLIVCDLDTSTMKRSTTELSCCATEKKNNIYFKNVSFKSLRMQFSPFSSDFLCL